jgi:RNA polymerase sigma-32 factor
VTANLRLVVKIAYEYRRAYKNIMDLIQEGNIGLMQAVKRYDPYRGVKLSSYAAWWIRAYILRFILNNWRLVKLGTTQAQRKLFFNLNKEKARLTAMGIEPTSLEIAKSLNVEEKEVIDMDRRLSSAEASLDAPVGDNDGRSVSRLELMPSAGSGPEAAFAEQEVNTLLRARLGEFRATLAGKDVIIFDKRMNAEDPLTLQELGDEFGISRERVRQLEARLTGKLRVYLRPRRRASPWRPFRARARCWSRWWCQASRGMVFVSWASSRGTASRAGRPSRRRRTTRCPRCSSRAPSALSARLTISCACVARRGGLRCAAS